eukprot:m51a1_g2925 putative dead deah box helicase (1735) ;mRNA; f:547738-557902
MFQWQLRQMSMRGQVGPTLAESPGMSKAEWTAAQLSSAISDERWGAAVDIVTPMRRGQLEEVTRAFSEVYGAELENVVKEIFPPGLCRDLLVAWIQGPVEGTVALLQEVAVAARDEELDEIDADERERLVDALIDAAVLDPAKMRLLLQRIEELPYLLLRDFPSQLDQVVGRKDLHFLQLLRVVFQQKIYDPNLVEQDARRLVTLTGERRLDTYVEVIGQRTAQHVRELERALKTTHKFKLVQAIKRDTSGLFQKLLLALVVPKDEYYASVMRKGIKVKSQRARQLLRVVRSSDKDDLVAVAAAYTWLYNSDPSAIGTATLQYKLLLGLMEPDPEESDVFALSIPPILFAGRPEEARAEARADAADVFSSDDDDDPDTVYGFDGGLDEWYPNDPNITLAFVPDCGSPDGSGCARVCGYSGHETYNTAVSPTFSVTPVKIELIGQNARFTTQWADWDKIGKWQRIVEEFQAPETATTAYFALEKNTDAHTYQDIFLDSVSIRAIQSYDPWLPEGVLYVSGLPPEPLATQLLGRLFTPLGAKDTRVDTDLTSRALYGVVTFASPQLASVAESKTNKCPVPPPTGGSIEVLRSLPLGVVLQRLPPAVAASVPQDTCEDKHCNAQLEDAEHEASEGALATPPGAVRVWVGNLPFAVSREVVLEHFGQFRPLAASLPQKSNGECRGFGWVSFGSKADAEAAIQALNKSSIDGRELIVQLSEQVSAKELPTPLPIRPELFVSNIPFTATQEKLEEFFAPYHPSGTAMVHHKQGGVPSFALLAFGSKGDAESALSLDRSSFCGRDIEVKWKTPSPHKAAAHRVHQHPHVNPPGLARTPAGPASDPSLSMKLALANLPPDADEQLLLVTFSKLGAVSAYLSAAHDGTATVTFGSRGQALRAADEFASGVMLGEHSVSVNLADGASNRFHHRVHVTGVPRDFDVGELRSSLPRTLGLALQELSVGDDGTGWLQFAGPAEITQALKARSFRYRKQWIKVCRSSREEQTAEALPDAQPSLVLCATGVSESVSSDLLLDVFGPLGALAAHVCAVGTPPARRAFVLFETQQQLEAALSELSGMTLEGSELQLGRADAAEDPCIYFRHRKRRPRCELATAPNMPVPPVPEKPARMPEVEETKLLTQEQRDAKRVAAGLPILQAKSEFVSRLLSDRVVVCVAETGSGKRVAQEFDGTKPGHSVGYRVCGRSVLGSRISFCTDSSLVRMAVDDPLLKEISTVMIDEAHERSLYTDIALGICKQVLERRPDFHVVVASATINEDKFLEYFGCRGGAIKVPGRLFNVDVEYRPPQNPRMIDNAALFVRDHVVPEVIRQMGQHTEGHALVFLPGQGEIERAVQTFERECRGRRDRNWVALPLFGSLPPEEQRKVLDFEQNNKGSGVRMAAFCTNVAETSLTVAGVTLVVDSGLAKEEVYDPVRRLKCLELKYISASSSNQRKGRAGRLCDGHCVRLHRPEDITREDIQPEITRASLDAVVLQLRLMSQDPLQFPFIDRPARESLEASVSAMQRLGFLDAKTGAVTEDGRVAVDLDFDPRLASFVISAARKGELDNAAIVAAVLSAPGSLFFMGQKAERTERQGRVATRAAQFDSDLLFLRTVYVNWLNSGRSLTKSGTQCGRCHRSSEGLNSKVIKAVDQAVCGAKERLARSRIVAAAGVAGDRDGDLTAVLGECLAAPFMDQLIEVLVPSIPTEGVRVVNTDTGQRITMENDGQKQIPANSIQTSKQRKALA